MKKIIALFLSLIMLFCFMTSASAEFIVKEELTTSEAEFTTIPQEELTREPSFVIEETTINDITLLTTAPHTQEEEIIITPNTLPILDRIYNAIRNFIMEIIDIIAQIVGKCNHSNCEMRYINIPSYECCEGYSGDLYCLDCGEIIYFGSVIQANMDHTYEAYGYSSVDNLVYLECTICHSAYMSETISPLNIDYIGTENNIMHFYCDTYTKILSITHIDGNTTYTYSSEIGDFYISLPTENEIITIIVEEYIGPGDILRKVTKSFNTQTKTWVEA